MSLPDPKRCSRLLRLYGLICDNRPMIWVNGGNGGIFILQSINAAVIPYSCGAGFKALYHPHQFD
jgi:hypothetical protein